MKMRVQGVTEAISNDRVQAYPREAAAHEDREAELG